MMSRSGLASAGGLIARLSFETQPRTFVTVPSFSAQVTPGRTTSAFLAVSERR